MALGFSRDARLRGIGASANCWPPVHVTSSTLLVVITGRVIWVEIEMLLL